MEYNPSIDPLLLAIEAKKASSKKKRQDNLQKARERRLILFVQRIKAKKKVEKK